MNISRVNISLPQPVPHEYEYRLDSVFSKAFLMRESVITFIIPF